MRVHGSFLSAQLTVDECSKIRHLLASLRLCKHRTRRLSLLEYLNEVSRAAYAAAANSPTYKNLFVEGVPEDGRRSKGIGESKE